MKIRNALEKPKRERSYTAAENREIRQKLIGAIHEQIKLYDVIDLFIKAFTVIILMHFISVALIIGIGSINLMKVINLKIKCNFCKYFV